MCLCVCAQSAVCVHTMKGVWRTVPAGGTWRQKSRDRERGGSTGGCLLCSAEVGEEGSRVGGRKTMLGCCTKLFASLEGAVNIVISLFLQLFLNAHNKRFFFRKKRECFAWLYNNVKKGNHWSTYCFRSLNYHK